MLNSVLHYLHYLITKEGDIIQLVNENDVAWHAGVSRIPYTNRTNINTCSIGIEIINTKTTGPNIKQYASLILLTKDICSRYNIQYILGHKDIAPNRKDDPWLFIGICFIKKSIGTTNNIFINILSRWG